jgi:hypothetical protein
VGAPLGPTVALTVTIGVAFFAVLAAVALLLVNPQPVPGLPEFSQRQDAETALYFLAFAVIVPAALIAVPRLADAIAARSGGEALSLLAAALAAALALAVIVARLLPGEGAVAVLIVLAVWAAGAVTALVRATRPRPWEALIRVERHAGPAWALAGALLLGSMLAFASLGSISPVALALGALLVAACLLAYRRGAFERLPRPSRGWGRAIDVAVVILLALVIPDLVIFEPGGAVGDPLAAFKAGIIQFHQDFLVGPANQVLAGDAVLVDTASQYGVAPIYLLAAWSELVPIGYGTTGLLDGLLYVLVFGAGYYLLRLARVARPLAIGAMALAVVILLYNLLFPVGGLLQHGELRFGLPMAVVVAATAAARYPARAKAITAVALAALGLSAIWALETFAYTAFTFAAVAALAAWGRSEPGRLRWLAKRLALGVAACVAAHLVLAALTLIFAGELPDWGRYYAYIDALVIGDLADITYDYTGWSAGLPVGIAYAASAVGVVLVAVRRPSLLEQERTAITALAGLTAYGIALYTYFVNRSADDILPYVSFPALVAGALWLSLLLRGALTASRTARLGGLAVALTLSLLLLSVAWSSIGTRFPHTPLAYGAPGGDSLRDAMKRAWNPPAIDPRAPQGELLLDRYMPDQRRVPIVVSPDLGVEILIRSGRAHSLPFSHPTEDFFAGFPTQSEIDHAVARLETGDRLLIQDGGLKLLDQLRGDPSRDVLTDPVPIASPDALTPQQQLMLQRIAARFRFRILERDEQGFVVVSLEARE